MFPRRVLSIGRYLVPLVAPLLLLSALAFLLSEPITVWLQGTQKYDDDVMREWIEQARFEYDTLESLLNQFYAEVDNYEQACVWQRKKQVAFAKSSRPGRPFAVKHNSADKPRAAVKPKSTSIIPLAVVKGQTFSPPTANIPIGDVRTLTMNSRVLTEAHENVKNKQGDIQKFLNWLAGPITTVHNDRLPLFPKIYQIKIYHDTDRKIPIAIWDSRLPREKKQYQEFHHEMEIGHGRKVYIDMDYQFRLYASRQDNVVQGRRSRIYLRGLITLGVTLGVLWAFLALSRARQRQLRDMRTQQEVLMQKVRTQETEQELLNEKLRRQAAEQTALKEESEMWNKIGIMAGSYAHNIKNLLVRPNDLLSRCLEKHDLPRGQNQMLKEVRQTLGDVTERLQQILGRVRQDPTQAKSMPLKLNDLLQEVQQTWRVIGQEKWLLTIDLDLANEPLWIEGDRSHLQQAIENLLFNARDATFQMRNHLRDAARQQSATVATTNRREALIAAAKWEGTVTLRCYAEGEHVVFEIQDNGIGMTEEVKSRCTETHFSTKRDNALFVGHSSGMGLGLAFVTKVLEHHQASMHVDSAALSGTTFQIKFPKKASVA